MLNTVHLLNKDPVANSVMAQTLGSIEISCITYTNPWEFLRDASPPPPACLLADMTLPDISPLRLLLRARRQGYLHPVLFTAHRVELDSIITLLRHGAFGFLQKPTNQMTLMENVQQALEQDRRVGPRLERAWTLQQRLAGLGRRERQVFEKTAGGQTAPEVAKSLGVSHRTVENQRLQAFRKLGIKGSAEAVRRWSELELLRAMGALWTDGEE